MNPPTGTTKMHANIVDMNARQLAGRKGGLSTSAAKAAAVRKNGCMPCGPGKKRGGSRKKVLPNS